MKKPNLPLALAIATCVATIQTPAFAQENVVPAAAVIEDSGKVRINIAGKLRMLSQRIPSAACHVAENIEKDAATALLVGASAEFEAILNALENGDQSMSVVAAEQDRKVLMKIAEVRELWEPMKAAADKIAAGDASSENVETLLNGNMKLLGAAKLLVTEVVGEYSNPADMVQAESMLIDVSGRQRMLTQKMSKEACILASDFKVDGMAESLQATMALFENSLSALQNGMPEVGIRRPPTPGIAAGLNGVRDNWNAVKPKLEAILAGDGATDEAKAAKFGLLNKTMADMNKVVGMYQDAITRGA